MSILKDIVKKIGDDSTALLDDDLYTDRVEEYIDTRVLYVECSSFYFYI